MLAGLAGLAEIGREQRLALDITRAKTKGKYKERKHINDVVVAQLKNLFQDELPTKQGSIHGTTTVVSSDVPTIKIATRTTSTFLQDQG
jgi:hypothetical protein